MSNHDRVSPELLLTHGERVRALARALVGDVHTADDVAQTAWVRALSRPPRPGGSLRAWWRHVVRSAAADSRRAAGRRNAHERHGNVPPPTERPDEVAARAESHRRVVAAVCALDEPHRSALVLRFFDGLSHAEIAAREGVAETAARKRVQRALERLRERLDAEHDGERARWTAWVLPLAGGAHAPDVSHGAARRGLPRVAAAACVLVAVSAAGAALLASGAAGCAPEPTPDGRGAPGPRDVDATQEVAGPPRDGEAAGEETRPSTHGSAAHSGRAADSATAEARLAASVSGRIVAEESAAPLADVHVSIGAVAVTTGDDGAFRITVAPESLSLRAVHAERGAVELLLPRRSASGDTRLCDIALGTARRCGVRVVDRAGAPVADARVRAFAAAWAEFGVSSHAVTVDDEALRATSEARTDASGRAELTGLLQRNATLLADAPGYAVSSPLTIDADAGRDALLVVEDAVQVRGRVVRCLDALPEADAEVVATVVGAALHGPSQLVVGRARSAQDGTFVLDGVPACVLELAPRARGGVRGAPALVDAATCPVAELLVDVERSLEGVVVDADDSPVAHADVTLTLMERRHEATVRCDAAGRFEFERLPAVALGSARLQAQVRDVGGMVVAESEWTTMRPGDGEARVVVVARGRIEGVVRDPDGAPLAGALVEVFGTHAGTTTRALGVLLASARSGADGSYRIAGLAPGRVEVHAQSDACAGPPTLDAQDLFGIEMGLRAPDTRIEISAGSTTHHDIAASRARIVRGHVVLPDGAPAAFADVVTSALRVGPRFAADARCDATGAFTLRGVPVTAGEALALRARLGDAVGACTVPDGASDAGITIVLGGSDVPRASIRGRVLVDAAARRGARLVVFEDGVDHGELIRARRLLLRSSAREVPLEADGRFEIPDLTVRDATHATLWLTAPGRMAEVLDVPLRAGASAEVALELRRGPRVAGRVLAWDGTPLEGVPVRACAADGVATFVDALPPTTLTAADGGFVIESVPTPTIGLIFGFGDPAPHVERDVVAGDEAVVVRIERGFDPRHAYRSVPEPSARERAQLPPVVLRGRIRDASGRAVAQAHVCCEGATSTGTASVGVTTDRDGAFELRGAWIRPIDVRVDGGPRGMAYRNGVATGPDAEIDIVLHAPRQPLRGRVVATDGAVRLDVLVHAVREDVYVRDWTNVGPADDGGAQRGPSECSVRAAEDGSFALGPLAHGRWVVWAGGPGTASATGGAVLRAHDDPSPLELPVAAGRTLRVRLVDADGAPRGGVILLARARDGVPDALGALRCDATTSHDGSAVFTGLPDAPVQVAGGGRDRRGLVPGGDVLEME